MRGRNTTMKSSLFYLPPASEGQKVCCSLVKTKAACNCGRMQADKDDPFDFKVDDQGG